MCSSLQRPVGDLSATVRDPSGPPPRLGPASLDRRRIGRQRLHGVVGRGDREDRVANDDLGDGKRTATRAS